MRRLLLLLVLVALAWSARKVAACISYMLYDIPSPVVGKYTDAKGNQSYVFPDAVDLRQLAGKPLFCAPKSPTTLMWGYEITGTPKYIINGLPPLDSNVDDVVRIPDSKNISKNIAAGELNPDGLASTITIRNKHLSPLGGPNTITTETGIIDPQVVTFWCSDGSLVTSQAVMFFTDAGGSSRLSDRRLWHLEAIDSQVESWVAREAPLGTVTTSTWGYTGKSLCFNVPKAGNNMWSMQSKYALFSLTANTVYRIRATMNCSQATVGKTPFWDFIIENYGTQNGVTRGLNLYGMDCFYLDNEGGANSVITTQNGTEFTMIWAPIAFRTPQWNDAANGIFSSKYSANKDPYLRFRVLDIEANPGLMSEMKSGQICLQQVVIESTPYSRFVEDSVHYNVTSPRAASSNDNMGNMYAKGLIGTSISYPSVNGNTVLNIQPTSAAQKAELVTVYPAVDLNGAGGANITAPYTQIADDWPIPWISGKIYKLEVGLVAPDANSQNHPFDVIWLGMEPPTNEIDAESFVTANQGIASPKTGTPQTYTFFYYTANETKSPVSALHFLRWRIRFGNSQSLNFPLTSDINNNSGSVRVTSVKVSQVHVQ